MKYTLWLIAYFSLLQASDAFAQQGAKRDSGVTSVNHSSLVKRMDSIFQHFNKKALLVLQSPSFKMARCLPDATMEWPVLSLAFPFPTKRWFACHIQKAGNLFP